MRILSHLRPFVVEAGVNIILPLLLYNHYATSLGASRALMISALPPILWSVAQVVRNRKLDALSLFVLAGIVLSLLALIGGGSARFLQLRENMVNALIGLVFLGSVIIKHPLLTVLAKAHIKSRQPETLDRFNSAMQNPAARKPLALMTLVWGLGLLANALLSCGLVFMMSIPAYMTISPIMGYGIYGILIAWTFWYSRYLKARSTLTR